MTLKELKSTMNLRVWLQYTPFPVLRLYVVREARGTSYPLFARVRYQRTRNENLFYWREYSP